MINSCASGRHWCLGFLVALGMTTVALQSFGQGGGAARGGRIAQGDRMGQYGRGPQRTPASAQPSQTAPVQRDQPVVVQQNRPVPVPQSRPIVQPGRTIMMPNRPAGPPEPASLKMRLEGQDLVADVRNTPLQQILEELAAWTGTVFEIDSQENPPISITFYRVSLQEAVQRLTGNNNSITYFERDETGQSRLSFVRIFARAPRALPPSLRYIGTGAITKRSDDLVDSPERALAVLAGSTSLVARQKAIEVLVSTKDAAAIQALKLVLTDPAVEIRVAAIEGLASLSAHDALPQILPALKDAHPGVRQSAILAVGLLGDASNVQDLKPLLRDPDSSVAASAVMAIQKLSARRP